MFDLPCILFAGGKSSRMGSDKSLLPFGNHSSLAQFQYERLAKLFSDVYISAKNGDKFDFNPKIILDLPDCDFAPTAGFIAAFEHLTDEWIFVLGVDTPFIDESIIQLLLNSDRANYHAVVCKTPLGTHPMVGIYHRSLLPQLQQMLLERDHRLGKLLNNSKTLYVNFDNEAHFANLNHPNEYEDAVSRYNSKINLK